LAGKFEINPGELLEEPWSEEDISKPSGLKGLRLLTSTKTGADRIELRKGGPDVKSA